MVKTLSKLKFIFDSVKRSRPEQKARRIEQDLMANELGLALQHILEYILKFPELSRSGSVLWQQDENCVEPYL